MKFDASRVVARCQALGRLGFRNPVSAQLSRFGGSATRPTPLREAYDATTLAAIETDQTLDKVFATLTGRTIAVVIANNGKPIGVLKRSDLLEYLAHKRGNSSR